MSKPSFRQIVSDPFTNIPNPVQVLHAKANVWVHHFLRPMVEPVGQIYRKTSGLAGWHWTKRH
jgi:hypothetical protein